MATNEEVLNALKPGDKLEVTGLIEGAWTEVTLEPTPEGEKTHLEQLIAHYGYKKMRPKA